MNNWMGYCKIYIYIQWNLLISNSLISNIALLATNLQVPGEDFVLILFPY